VPRSSIGWPSSGCRRAPAWHEWSDRAGSSLEVECCNNATFGHTAGHQSLRARLDSGDVVLTGDACYLRRSLEELALPSLIHDQSEMLASLELLRILRDRGARLIFGHDAAQWPEPRPVPMRIEAGGT